MVWAPLYFPASFPPTSYAYSTLLSSLLLLLFTIPYNLQLLEYAFLSLHLLAFEHIV